jgi:uncharacterized protein
MQFKTIIDSHTHWGPSNSMGTNVTTNELLRQQKETGITHVMIMPFPSTAIDDNDINLKVFDETKRISHFIPYHYIRENFDNNGFDPIPEQYYGGKWHWMRGVQDASSNYSVLNEKALPGLIEKLSAIGRPVIFEEELPFTKRFVNMAPDVKLIIPHLGLLGGDPYEFLNEFKNNKNIYFDTALAEKSAIFEFVRTIGPERVLFGSDVPFGSMKNELSKVLSLEITDAEKEMLLYKNFVRLTGYKI